MSRALALLALLVLVCGCASGYNAGVKDVGAAHLLPQWKTWGAARAVAAAPQRLAAVRAAVRRSHAQPVSVTIYHVRNGETAPAVVLASFTPRSWLLHRSRRLLDDIRGIVGAYGQYYVGLVDRNGRFVWETGRALSESGPAGGVYAPREIDACQPVVHGYPALATSPPPCRED